MTVVSTRKDTEALTLTFVTELDASTERVWQLWQDPRQLERWWGPPTWPATFETHEFAVGGRSRYYMTGPEGEKSRGWWGITALDAPHRIEYDDGFADDAGEPSTSMAPMHCIVTLEPEGGRTRMTVVTTFADAEEMEKTLAMGMEEGMGSALGQIDAILAADPR
jgi:uncharacterized protein YndB with AHSA1/START domain